MDQIITVAKIYIGFFVVLFILCFLQGVVFRKAPKAPVEIEQMEITDSRPVDQHPNHVAQPPASSTAEDLKVLAGGYSCYADGRFESRHVYADGMMIYSYKGKIFYAKIIKLDLLQGTMTAQQVASTTGDEWVSDKKAVIQSGIFIDPELLNIAGDSYSEPVGSVKDPVKCQPTTRDELDQYRQRLLTQLR